MALTRSWTLGRHSVRTPPGSHRCRQTPCGRATAQLLTKRRCPHAHPSQAPHTCSRHPFKRLFYPANPLLSQPQTWVKQKPYHWSERNKNYLLKRNRLILDRIWQRSPRSFWEEKRKQCPKWASAHSAGGKEGLTGLREAVRGGSEQSPKWAKLQGQGRQAEECRFDVAGNKKSERLDLYSVLTNTNCFWVALSSFRRTRSSWNTGLFFIM